LEFRELVDGSDGVDDEQKSRGGGCHYIFVSERGEEVN
jgi:hypothetical protein